MEYCMYCEKERAGKDSCCGELHFEDLQECESCGSYEYICAERPSDMLAPECSYYECAECGFQWAIPDRLKSTD